MLSVGSIFFTFKEFATQEKASKIEIFLFFVSPTSGREKQHKLKMLK